MVFTIRTNDVSSYLLNLCLGSFWFSLGSFVFGWHLGWLGDIDWSQVGSRAVAVTPIIIGRKVGIEGYHLIY